MTGCDEPAWVFEVTSKFPKTAAEATPATKRAGDASMLTDRKVATTVVQTVRDVWMRSFRAPGDFGSVTGLRGGSSDFDWSTAPHVFNDMHAVRFATDVAVSGDTDLNGDTTLTRFQVSVNGPGPVDGVLSGEGAFGSGVYRDFVVTGTLGGRTISVRVPAN